MCDFYHDRLGYKGHIAEDPDSEIITATADVGNAGDVEPAEDLLAADLPASEGGDDADEDRPGDSGDEVGAGSECGGVAAADTDTESVAAQQLAVYGDASYGAGPLLVTLENAGAQIVTKVQPSTAPGGRFGKDRFTVDLATGSVTCPGHVRVAIRPATGGGGVAAFATACVRCPLAVQCTTSPAGRTVTIGAPVMTAAALPVSDAQRAELERMAASTSLPHRRWCRRGGCCGPATGWPTRRSRGAAVWTRTRCGAGVLGSPSTESPELVGSPRAAGASRVCPRAPSRKF